MFPIRESSRHLFTSLLALLIVTQIVFLSITVLKFTSDLKLQPLTEKQMNIAGLKDNWELLSYMKDSNQMAESEALIALADNIMGITEKRETTETITTIASNTVINEVTREKLDKLAAKYQADPEYLEYIIKVEKTFKLEPCELLALIAQESGFKPQTHMDGGSLSYSTTQMKMATAKTAYMAITEYYNMEIPYPTHELLSEDKYYATFLAGGYLRYLHDTYKDKYESYTAYNWGIGGRMTFYKNYGHFRSPYAVKVTSLGDSFNKYIGAEYCAS